MYLVDIFIVLLYAMMVVYNGVKNSAKESHFEYYAFGRNKLSSTSIAYSMITALIGANFIIGNLGGYNFGILYFAYTIFTEVLSFIVWGRVFSLKGFANEKYSSVCDIIEDLYGRKAAIMSGIIATISSLFSVVLQLYVCCYFFECTVGISKIMTCTLLCSLMLFYVTFFGIDSITRTNIFQIITMVIIFPILLSIAVYEVGDVGNLYKTVHIIESIENTSSEDICNMLMILMTLGCCPPIAHRRFIAFSGGQFFKAMKKTCICIVLFQVFFVLLGMCYTYGYTGSVSFSQEIFIGMIQNIPHFLRGVVFAGFISIVLSSVDAHTHTGVVAFIYDVIRRLKGDMPSYSDFLLKYARIGIVVFLIISTCIAICLGDISLVPLVRMFWCVMVIIPLFIGVTIFPKPGAFSWFANLFICVVTYTFLCVGQYCGFFHFNDSEIVMLSCASGILGFLIACIYATYKKDPSLHVFKDKFLQGFRKYARSKYEDMKLFMLETIKSLNYYRYTKKIFDISGVNSAAFAILMLFNVFFSSFCNVDNDDMYIVGIVVKFIASVLVLTSVMYKYMPSFYVENRKIFFIITLILCCPVYSFIFIGITNGDMYWHVYTMINIILLAFIIDWVNFFIILASGFMLSVCIFRYLLDMNIDICNIICNNFEIGLLYTLTCGVCFVVFYGKRFLVEHTNMNAYKSSVGIISHETVTPLMLINNKLKKIMKIDVADTEIMEKLRKLASDGILFVSSIFSFYDLFLKNMISFGRDSSKIKVIEVSAKTAITHIMSLYPLNDTQKHIINMDLKDDFMIAVNMMLLKHVIHNVIRNALFFVAGRENPRINIRLESHTYRSYNYIEISDNGVGMNSKTVDNIFQKFYTKRINGAGLGLYFCKNAMYSMMGDISAESVEGKGSAFTLMFPHSDVVENVIKWDGDISSLC